MATHRTADGDREASFRQFEAEIAAIHGLNGGSGMDTRQAELLAMFRAFLGADYDPRKAQQVVSIQSQLHSRQQSLLSDFDAHKLSAEAYVTAFNKASTKAFAQVEEVLGTTDFQRLFGAHADAASGCIDLAQFLKSEGLTPR